MIFLPNLGQLTTSTAPLQSPFFGTVCALPENTIKYSLVPVIVPSPYVLVQK